MLIALLTVLSFCPGYHVRGMEYDVCGEGTNPGLYVIDKGGSGYGYRVDPLTWVRSQIDPSLGDDERLGA